MWQGHTHRRGNFLMVIILSWRTFFSQLHHIIPSLSHKLWEWWIALNVDLPVLLYNPYEKCNVEISLSFLVIMFVSINNIHPSFKPLLFWLPGISIHCSCKWSIYCQEIRQFCLFRCTLIFALALYVTFQLVQPTIFCSRFFMEAMHLRPWLHKSTHPSSIMR